MQEIRVALIGTGAISNRHMKVWGHIPQVKVVAAAEIDEAKLKAWGERYGFDEKDLYTDFREMLKRDDIDAVDVCVHNNLHTPVSTYVLKAGYPCYSEKPMSATYFDSKLLYDTAIETGQKLAIQISSLYSMQTYIAKKVIEAGKLGDVYHARSATASRRRRNAVDRPALFSSVSFREKEMAGHGQIVDLGCYHFGQMLYLLGLPELTCVLGKLHNGVAMPSEAWAKSHPMTVEDMGVGFATFANGLSLEIQEASAINRDDFNDHYIMGSKGGLTWGMTDDFGGDWSMGGMGPMGPTGLPGPLQPQLKYRGLDEFGFDVTIDYNAYENQQDVRAYDPEMLQYLDNQLHWYNYLIGKLTDETRYNTPLIGLNASLLTEGLVLSSELGRSVTADEIKAMSKSMGIWKQETPWGVFDYEATL
ncbi:MAG: Gfo/Idh/MocA family oxidoreductase [Lachnospiraceae bacterium]|nr:Gfo/Idh/MocA family oxidoreductase [Lachnospiraceae bacterium]